MPAATKDAAVKIHSISFRLVASVKDRCHTNLEQGHTEALSVSTHECWGIYCDSTSCGSKHSVFYL